MRGNIARERKTNDIVFIALFAVLIVLCSWISIPSVIPITMQTFAVFFAFSFLGGKRGTLAVCLYIMLGVLGLPVYAGFTSGAGVLFGATGGYMLGWILAGIITCIVERLLGNKLWTKALSMLVGLIVCYFLGTLWFVTVYARDTGSVGFGTAMLCCVVPFIIPDTVKLVFALWLGKRLDRIKAISLAR